MNVNVTVEALVVVPTGTEPKFTGGAVATGVVWAKAGAETTITRRTSRQLRHREFSRYVTATLQSKEVIRS